MRCSCGHARAAHPVHRCTLCPCPLYAEPPAGGRVCATCGAPPARLLGEAELERVAEHAYYAYRAARRSASNVPPWSLLAVAERRAFVAAVGAALDVAPMVDGGLKVTDHG